MDSFYCDLLLALPMAERFTQPARHAVPVYLLVPQSTANKPPASPAPASLTSSLLFRDVSSPQQSLSPRPHPQLSHRLPTFGERTAAAKLFNPAPGTDPYELPHVSPTARKLQRSLSSVSVSEPCEKPLLCGKADKQVPPENAPQLISAHHKNAKWRFRLPHSCTNVAQTRNGKFRGSSGQTIKRQVRASEVVHDEMKIVKYQGIPGEWTNRCPDRGISARNILPGRKECHWVEKKVHRPLTFPPKDRLNVKAFCGFCKKNGETVEVYSQHQLSKRADDGSQIVACPVLRKLKCEMCGASGDHAHTKTRCPLSQNSVPLAVLLKRTPRRCDGSLRTSSTLQ